jgi:hypothetical protein
VTGEQRAKLASAALKELRRRKLSRELRGAMRMAALEMLYEAPCLHCKGIAFQTLLEVDGIEPKGQG